MGMVCGGNQELWVQDVIIVVDDVVGRHWVHMMYDDLVIDLIPFDSEVKTYISCDDIVPDLLPLSRGIESLVQITVEAESGLPDFTTEPEIVITLVKGVKPSEFRI